MSYCHMRCMQALELRMQALLAAGRRVILLGASSRVVCPCQCSSPCRMPPTGRQDFTRRRTQKGRSASHVFCSSLGVHCRWVCTPDAASCIQGICERVLVLQAT
jgi:hypothetical protein